MTEKLEMYRCEIYGNLVQVILSGAGELVCCGQPMKQVVANNIEEVSLEKHVPVFRKKDNNGLEIQVGTQLHPMDDDHYIMFIETISEDRKHLYLEYLQPGQEAKIELQRQIGKEKALAFCNLHGLWEGEND